MSWELKKLEDKSLEAAIGLARHYRNLNQPEEAESICRDVLEVAPLNTDGLRTLGLALTDRFSSEWMSLFEEACATFRKLPSEYERVYYVGIAWERFAKAQLESGRAHNAIHAFEQAIEKFDAAAPLAEKDDPAPTLHYNRCVRALTTHPELTRLSGAPPQPHYEFGD